MFLHLVDDDKFIAGAMDIFNRTDPGSHLFIRIVGPASGPAKYICNVRGIVEIKFNSPQYTELMVDLEKYTAVFIHSFFSVYHIHTANKASSKAVLVWLFWGGEIWTLPRFRNRILLPRTRLLYHKHIIVPWIQRNIKKYTSLFGPDRTKYTYFRKKKCSPLKLQSDLEQAIRRVDYIIPVYEDDFHLLQQMIPCKAQQLKWNYPPPQPCETLESLRPTSTNILVGNSASYSNNHLELFRRLIKIKGHTGKVIVPLSYGDAQYRNDIIKFGKSILKERFCPLTEFLPYAAYLDTLCSCSAAFFNTRRQQAMGNILPLLYLGKRVFLREENPVYHFLVRNEIVVFSIQKDIPVSAETLSWPLTASQIQKNRKAIKKIADERVLESKTQQLIQYLIQNRTK